MMKCRMIRGDLSAYLDGEVSASMRIAIERHLAECAECARYKGELEKTVTLLHGVERVKPSASFRADTMRRIRTTVKDPVRRPVLVRRPAMTFACAAIGVLMVVGWFWLFGYSGGSRDADLTVNDEIVTALLASESAETAPGGEAVASLGADELPLVLASAYSDDVPVEEMAEMLSESEKTEFRAVLVSLAQEGK